MTITETQRGHRIRDRFPLPSPALEIGGRARRSERYPVHITRSPAATLQRLAPLVQGRGVAIITDNVVEPQFAPRLIAGLRELGCDVLVRAVPAGEASKSLEQAIRLWGWLARSTLARRDVILALGGGVIADLGGRARRRRSLLLRLRATPSGD